MEDMPEKIQTDAQPTHGRRIPGLLLSWEKTCEIHHIFNDISFLFIVVEIFF